MSMSNEHGERVPANRSPRLAVGEGTANTTLAGVGGRPDSTMRRLGAAPPAGR